MSETHSPVKVTIFGSDYTLRGESNEEYIHELANYVNEKMNEISNNTTLSNTLKISILAAINLADEIFRLRKHVNHKVSSSSDKTLPSEEPAGIPLEAIAALSAHIDTALNEESKS